MSFSPGHLAETVVEFHMLGHVEFDECRRLQDYLVHEAATQRNGQVHVLLCEHPPAISIGRGGSRGHIRLTAGELAARGLSVHWTSRGGGCVPHGPGQLAVYPIVWLPQLAWNVGDYLRRLNLALRGTLRDLGYHGENRCGSFGVWGRTGQLAACGVSVRYDVTSHGAFLNVNPPMDLVRRVDVTPPRYGDSRRSTGMSCLLAEHGRPVRMTKVRSATVENMAQAFQCTRYHIHSSHALITSLRKVSRDASSRAS